MELNVGNIDRILRIVVGLVIIAVGVYFSSWWGAVGLVPLLTGLSGRCPAYMPFGMKTCRIEKTPS